MNWIEFDKEFPEEHRLIIYGNAEYVDVCYTRTATLNLIKASKKHGTAIFWSYIEKPPTNSRSLIEFEDFRKKLRSENKTIIEDTIKWLELAGYKLVDEIKDEHIIDLDKKFRKDLKIL